MQQERFEYLASKKLGDQLSDDELQEFEALLQQQPDLRKQYKLLQQYWSDKHSQNQRDRELFQNVLQRIDRIDLPRKRDFRNVWMPLGLAASLLLAVGLFVFYFSGSGEHKFVADRKQQKVILDDGTEVVLNYKSTLYYPDKFEDDIRQVTVVGEAFFRVAKEKDRPFIVHTKNAILKVLGTSFNVRAYPDETTTEASLIEGALEVTANDKKATPILLKPAEKVIIPNQQLQKIASRTRIAPKKVKITFFKPTDVQAVETTWLENRLVFKDQTFAELAKALERKYDTPIEFTDASLAQLRFTARFEQENLEEILSALQLAATFQYRIHDNRIRISRN
ncbi:FecR family protein [Sphingobacterium chungjuense]|uniref:FecR family protein n=1 Tax=Sphingobacterium chungjuense TaxID=2675553 RepID=UPI00140BF4DE|nr:FecR domain-containing protein [Sphingobacterium chungjuense]